MSIGEWVGKPPVPRETPWNEWPLPSCRVGLEYEFEDPYMVGKPGRGAEPFWRYFELHSDGSLRDAGLEFVLKTPLMGTELKAAIDSMHAYKSRLQSSYRTSMHVHMDVRDMELSELQSLCFLYALTEKWFYAFATQYDGARETSNYCIPWFCSDGCIQAVAEAVFSSVRSDPAAPAKFSEGIAKIERYAGLNLAAIGKFGSVEFRHMPTVTEPEIVYNWVKLCMSLKAAAQRSTLDHWKRVALQGMDAVKAEVFGNFNFVPPIEEHDYDMCFSTAALVESLLSVRQVRFKHIPGARGRSPYHAQATGEPV